MKSTDFDNSPSKPTRLLLAWGSLALATAESLCVAVVGLSGMRVVLGLTSLLAAGAGGPARGLHREAIRIPLLTVGAIGALISLLLLWNEERLRACESSNSSPDHHNLNNPFGHAFSETLRNEFSINSLPSVGYLQKGMG